MKKIIVAAAILLSSCTTHTGTVVDPKGDFASIDVGKSNAEFALLLKNDGTSVQRVLQSPGNYNPAVLYALSSALFETGRLDEALPWFYLAQLRARSDAAKALDISARESVTILNNRFGPKINRHAFSDLQKLKAAVAHATALDTQIPRNYDARWIALHGMDAFSKTTVRFEPKERWNSINQRVRDENLEAFRAALKH